jgi:hypothetical protein
MTNHPAPDAFSSSTEASCSQLWHALYDAALFETDRRKIPLRIAEAEKAILNRVRELFVVNTDHIEEDQILDDALYTLRALRKLCRAGSECCLVAGFYWHSSSDSHLQRSPK